MEVKKIPISFIHPHVLETILTNPKFGLLAVLFRVRAEIPGIYLVTADLMERK